MDALDDAAFDAVAQNHTIFARISPEQKARLIVSARRTGRSVAFLGDGVNDALALHAADVGISVDTAADVAKDAADVVLLEKDLGVLADRRRRGPAHLRQHHQVRADGHVEQLRQHVQRGRRLGGADVPADAAQPDPAEQPALRQLAARDPHRQRGRRATARALALEHRVHPAIHAHLRADQLAVRLPDVRDDARRAARRAGPVPHRLVRGIPCHPDADHLRDPHPAGAVPPQQARSRPDTGRLRRVAVGVVLTVSPLAHKLGFTTLPWLFYTALVLFTVAYLVLVELIKTVFYADPMHLAAQPPRTRGREHRIHRRAARFSHAGSIAHPPSGPAPLPTSVPGSSGAAAQPAGR